MDRPGYASFVVFIIILSMFNFILCRHCLFLLASLSGRSKGLGHNIDRIKRNSESTEPKIAKIFKRPKNREDGSDFDDFLMRSIVSAQSIFSKIFERTKNYRTDRTDRFDRSIARSIVPTDGRRGFVVDHRSAFNFNPFVAFLLPRGPSLFTTWL